MRYQTLPGTELEVSEVCLGTMTWGEQNSEAEAHAQLDYAFEHGVNFIDTAEMYPAPPNATTQGRTEAFVGSWIVGNGPNPTLVATSTLLPGVSLTFTANVVSSQFNIVVRYISAGRW